MGQIARLFKLEASPAARFWLNHRGESIPAGGWMALYRRTSGAPWQAYTRRGEVIVFPTDDDVHRFLDRIYHAQNR